MRLIILALLASIVAPAAAETPRPNILWLTSEDNGPHLGCYGDTYATTPNLDALAARGMIYHHAWSSAPVCAPARTAIITGVSPTSLGAEHMRSMVPLPATMRLFPQLLRQAGYYCTNNSKEDYNVEKPGRVWDESSPRAHWRKRNAGQPFFAVFNQTVTHESQIRKRPHEPKHDPAKVRVPAYHPDTPEVRADWAQYYDKLTEMDALAGGILRQLEADGLADDTIVFYYGDHGPGMPRCKRSPLNSGLRVPLIVYIPPKFRHLASKNYVPGAGTDRLVRFEDFAPTVLSLAGISAPDWMQGRAFLGPFEAPPNQWLYGFRGRMDERYDLVRSMTDGRYVYVRNFMPHLPAGQHNAYMFETPTTQVWKKLFDEGRLTREQSLYWERRAPEELYDLQKDLDEVRNLAASPEHREILERMRATLRKHLLDVRDIGFLPENEIHSRSGSASPYEVGHDAAQYPLQQILTMAELASSREPGALPQLCAALGPAGHSDSAVRWWAVVGVLIRGQTAVDTCRTELGVALKDASPWVRITAAQALAGTGNPAELDAALGVLLEAADLTTTDVYTAIFALNAIDALGEKSAAIRPKLASLPRTAPSVPQRVNTGIPKLLDFVLAPP